MNMTGFYVLARPKGTRESYMFVVYKEKEEELKISTAPKSKSINYFLDGSIATEVAAYLRKIDYEIIVTNISAEGENLERLCLTGNLHFENLEEDTPKVVNINSTRHQTL